MIQSLEHLWGMIPTAPQHWSNKECCLTVQLTLLSLLLHINFFWKSLGALYQSLVRNAIHTISKSRRRSGGRLLSLSLCHLPLPLQVLGHSSWVSLHVWLSQVGSPRPSCTFWCSSPPLYIQSEFICDWFSELFGFVSTLISFCGFFSPWSYHQDTLSFSQTKRFHSLHLHTSQWLFAASTEFISPKHKLQESYTLLHTMPHKPCTVASTLLQKNGKSLPKHCPHLPFLTATSPQQLSPAQKLLLHHERPSMTKSPWICFCCYPPGVHSDVPHDWSPAAPQL